MTDLTLLEQQAVDAAINAEWGTAIILNKKILHDNTEDIDACLRLGFAYLQSNDLKEAQKYYKRALRIQPKNIIAMEHLEKIEILESKNKAKTTTKSKYDSDLFLEVHGRTRTSHLVNLGQKEDLAGRNIGEEVMLKEKKRRLEVRSFENEYIGTLPDDISKRLIYFIQEGSEYSTYIKEIDMTDMVVFVKEESKGAKVRQYPSFPSNPHVMLTDIQQAEEEDDEKDEDDDTEEEEDDVDMTNNIAVDDEEDDDDEWEDMEEDKELEGLVHVDEEEEE